MRRTAFLAVLVLVLAACGGDAADGDDQTTVTTAAATTTTTTAAETTTTTAATTTTTTATNAALAGALAIQGSYEGEWSNTTFGSTGSITLDIAVDEATGIATITMDLGGFVFGAGDPDPIEYEIDLSEDPDLIESTDPVFGDSTFEASEDGSFVFEAAAVPGLGGTPMTIEGTVGPDGFSGTYTIPDLAEGTFEAIPSN